VALLVGSIALAIQVYTLVTTPPATGYEPSVVTPYPIEHWIAFGVTLAVVVVVCLGAAIRDTGYWRYALGVLAGAYGIHLTLPIARGYAVYGRGGSDQLFHLALVDDLVATGQPPGVFYPHLHFLAAELVGFSVPLGAVQHLIAYAATMLFILGTATFVRALVDDRRGFPLGLAVATPLLLGEFHGQFHPAVLSFALVPILGAALERARRTGSRRHTVAAAAFLFAVVFLHPVTTIMAGVLVASTALSGVVYARATGRGVRRLRVSVALALVPTAFVWYTGFERTQNALVRILAASSVAPVGRQADIVAGAELSTTEIAMRFVQLYGAQFLYFGLGGLCVLAVGWWLIRRRDVGYVDAYVAGQYVVGGGLAVMFMLVYLIAFNPIRVSRYLVLGSLLVVAVVYGRRLTGSAVGRPADRETSVSVSRAGPGANRYPGSSSETRHVRTDGGSAGSQEPANPEPDRSGPGSGSTSWRTKPGRSQSSPSPWRGVATVVLAVTIVTAGCLGAFTAYQPNKHMTYGEQAGTEFTLRYGDGTPVRALALSLKHQLYVLGDRGEEYPRAVFGTDRRHAIEPGLVPSNATAVDTYGRSYLATSTYDTGWHTAEYYTPAQQAARVVYTEQDLTRLAADPTTNRVYSNDAYDLYLIDG
jgi:hypothetical protein